MSPEEYAKAVQGYSRLPTGAGQNHISLGEFLTSKAVAIDIQHSPPSKDFVILYPLGAAEDTPASPSLSPPPQPILSDPNAEPDSTDERQHAASNFACFNDPQEFFRYGLGRSRPQSCIIFLRGFMSPAWINNIGSRYFIDPEFFCRHLDFRPTDDNSNNFSIPALPSSSWHLIELPVITIGTRMAHKGATWVEKVEMLRREGVEALASHHHRIAKLSSSGMAVGDSMVRGFYVFDETHFAIEQRISICMQANRGHKSFSRKTLISFFISLIPYRMLGEWLSGTDSTLKYLSGLTLVAIIPINRPCRGASHHLILIFFQLYGTNIWLHSNAIFSWLLTRAKMIPLRVRTNQRHISRLTTVDLCVPRSWLEMLSTV